MLAKCSTKKEQALAALKLLPPFSPILQRLIASLAQEGVSFARIGDLIEKDVLLSGNTLALVNSAAFGLRGRVESIRQAIGLLGISKLRNAVLSLSMTAYWKQVREPACYSIRDFNVHSVAVGILADLLAQRLQLADADGAFPGGLFHDLGAVLTAIALAEDYRELTERRQKASQPSATHEVEVLGYTVADLSADALASWNLPKTVQDAVRFQNKPVETLSGDPSKLQLHMVLNAARRHVQQLGIAPSIQAHSEDGYDLESFNLGPLMEPMLKDFDDEFSAIRQFF